MAIAVGASKWATKVAREWANERVQWGRPIGKHDAVAQKLAFIAGSAFGLEAMLDVSARLADDKRNDIRIEAALCKVYGSELAWKVIDELMQVRGGRGYETAESLKARGEKPVPVEQAMRDMRVNRIFEGLERDHAPADRPRGGRYPPPSRGRTARCRDGDAKAKADAAMKAGLFYGKWLPQLAVGKGQNPRSYDEFGPLAGDLRYVERASRKLARSTFYGMARWQAKLENKQTFLGRIVDIGAELFAISSTVVYADTRRTRAAGAQGGGDRARAAVLLDGQAQSRHAVPRAVGQRRRQPVQRGAEGAGRAATAGSRTESSTPPATAR